jgi:hypothetical protein
MPKRTNNPRNDWPAVNNFNHNTVSPDLWHTARHEAAHLLTAAYYGIAVQGIYIRVPGAAKCPLEPNALGAVMVYNEPVAGDIVCTLAGTIVDLKILGSARALEDHGFKNDIKDAGGIIRNAVRDRSYSLTRLYVSQNHVLTGAEVKAQVKKFMLEAAALIERHWDAIETLAAAIIVSASNSTGRVHGSKVGKLYEYAASMR